MDKKQLIEAASHWIDEKPKSLNEDVSLLTIAGGTVLGILGLSATITGLKMAGKAVANKMADAIIKKDNAELKKQKDVHNKNLADYRAKMANAETGRQAEVKKIISKIESFPEYDRMASILGELDKLKDTKEVLKGLRGNKRKDKDAEVKDQIKLLKRESLGIRKKIKKAIIDEGGESLLKYFEKQFPNIVNLKD